ERHGGGLTGPVGAEKAGHHPRTHVEAERLDRERAAVAFGQIADLDHVISRVTRTPAPAGPAGVPRLSLPGDHAMNLADRPERGKRPSSSGGFPPDGPRSGSRRRPSGVPSSTRPRASP